MGITIRVRGLKELSKKMNNLVGGGAGGKGGGGTLADNADKLNYRLGRFIRNSAKRRAPVFEGDLKNSIKILKHTKKQVTVGSEIPYAVYQEKGSTPHYVSAQTAASNPKLQRYAERIGLAPGGNWAIFFSGKAHPFLTPAKEAAMKQFPRLARQALGAALRQAGFK